MDSDGFFILMKPLLNILLGLRAVVSDTREGGLFTGIATSPLLTLVDMSRAEMPSIMHPMDEQVPRTSMTVPLSSRASDFVRFLRAMSMIWSRVRFPWCLTAG